MRAIEEEVRQLIRLRAQEQDAEGRTPSRRQIAREFGISPQSVARILDGPTARRGQEPQEGSGAGELVGIAIVLCVWGVAALRRWRKRRGGSGEESPTMT
jgi:hypothetical protein